MSGRSASLWHASIVLGILAASGYAAWPAPATVVGNVTTPDGAPLPARVVIATRDWKKSRVAFTDRKGKYRLDFQTGKCRIMVSHGPEYTAVEHAAQLTTGPNRIDFELRCLLDMSRLGWHCGDVHVHSKRGDGAQQPAAIARAARCEGLDWAVLTDAGATAGLQEWLAQGSPDFIPLPGQKLATSRGDILALGASEPITADTGSGANDIFRICTETRAQGGLAIVAHPNTHAMAYRDWDLNACDGIEILNGALPPFLYGFDLLQARRTWYDLLNAGRRPLALGGSDNRDTTAAALRQFLGAPAEAAKKHQSIRLLRRALGDKALRPFARRGGYLGFVRTYVHSAELTRDSILAALRKGAVFVTTGPLLLATVDGCLPGEIVHTRGRNTVTLTLEAVSNRAFDRIDIIADGEVVKSIPGAQLMRIQRTLELPIIDRHWLVLECYGSWPDMAVTGAWRLDS